MRAVVVKSFKSAPEIAEVPVPQPEPDEVLVRLSAAGVNPFDWKIADGMLDGQVGHTFPLVLGLDGAGTVEAVGTGTKRFAVGDRVFGQFWQIPLGRGTYTQYCAVSESAPLARKPDPLSMADAAALPTAGMTALDLLEKSGLTMGDTILIVGATGGVGQFLTQLARQRALYVIATGTTADVDMLKALGAHSVVDFTAGSVTAQVREQVPDGIDGLFDLVSEPAGFITHTALVRKGGVALTTNFVADENALASSGIRGGNFTLGASSALVKRLGAAAGTGKVKIPIERRVPFDEALTAIEASRYGHARGKTVILI
jgi:NADPH:quinone reductase-like Zn-dependent oxidoreductase